MGYALPAAIGAAFACPDRPVYCVIGDGSLMMNLQDLQIVAQHSLNIRIIVINNAGYGMIMQTQSDWDTLEQGISCNKKGGVTFPDYESIADAFKIWYVEPRTSDAITKISTPTVPQFINAHIKTGSKIAPKQLWGDELWNQKPYQDKEEIAWIENTLLGKS